MPAAPLSDLAALAANHAREAERERRLAPPVVDALADAGVFRMLVPRSVGGGEAGPTELVETVAAIARGDGAAGWCAAIGATSGALAAYLEPEHAREVYGLPARCWGGVFAPKGRVVERGDCLEVTGRWPFASGIDHCDWLMGGCLVGGDVRLVLFPAGEVRRIDTWHTAGLRGTGSHDMAVDGVLVPSARSASLVRDTPVEPGPAYAFPVFGLLALAIAATGLGIARGAIDDLGELAATKTPAMSARTLASRSDTQERLARAEARMRAARALVDEEAGAAWTEAKGEGAVGLERRARLRMAACHAMAEAASVTDAMYALGGGSVVYESSTLGRRFRDVHVATQHMLVAPAVWQLAGRVLLGESADTSQL